MTRERVLKLPVLEIFGPTFQGEGRAIGQKTMFVRTAGCDYHCDWCDSAFTWDGSEKPTRMTADEVIAELDKLGSYDYVTLSGGNPAILAANMAQLVTKLKERGVTLAVETQGSRWQNWLKDIDQVTLSPKPPSSKMEVNFETLDFIVSQLDPDKVTFKIPVFDDADLEKAATGLIASKYRNAGQTCVCANRVYVQASIKDKFLAIFKQKVEALKVGNGMTEGVNIGPLINQGALDKVEQLLADAVNKGATVVTGGKKHSASDLSFEPTVITGITDDMDIASQEIFGPIAPVFVFDSDDEVIAHANNTIYGLAAYFYTQSLARSWKVCEGLEYGMVAQNTGLLSTEVAPFGGVKQSGFGREGSKYGIDEYVTTKYWCIDVQ